MRNVKDEVYYSVVYEFLALRDNTTPVIAKKLNLGVAKTSNIIDAYLRSDENLTVLARETKNAESFLRVVLEDKKNEEK